MNVPVIYEKKKLGSMMKTVDCVMKACSSLDYWEKTNKEREERQNPKYISGIVNF
jgi:hypothetical protein